MQPTRRSNFLKSLLILAFLAVLATLLYTFTHEAGHALLGLMFGGKLTSFSVRFWDLSAHAGINGDFSVFQRSLISVAGISLPLILWMLFLALAPKKTSPLVLWFKIFGSMGVLNTLLAWIIIPFLFLAGRAPSDDSTHFLSLTGTPPLLVSAVALAVYVYGWALLLNRVGGLRGLRSRLSLEDNRLLDRPSLRALAALIAIFVGVTVLSLGIAAFYPFADALAAPEDYEPVFLLDLSRRAYNSEVVYTFTLAEPADVGLFFALKEVSRGPVRITLVGSGGYQNTFLRAPEDFSTGQSTVNSDRIPLGPGEYAVEITFPRCDGSLSGAVRFLPPLD